MSHDDKHADKAKDLTPKAPSVQETEKVKGGAEPLGGKGPLKPAQPVNS